MRHWQPPFKGYENASRQFERSVNAVQQMLTTQFNGFFLTMIHCHLNCSSRSEPRRYIPRETSIVVSRQGRQHQDSARLTYCRTTLCLKAADFRRLLQERRVHLQSQANVDSLTNTMELLGAKDHLSPLEQQFVDLARITAAKDTIIANQRTEIEQLTAQVQAASM